MNKKWIIFLAIVTLTLLPALAQDSVGYTNGHGNGGCGNGGNGGNNGNGNGGNGGNGNGGNGNGNGYGPIHNIYDGIPFSFSGTVVSTGLSGSGLVVSTENGDITVTGLGPMRYWYSLGVQKPVVGDAVSGNGYTVDYNGFEQNVLTDITVNGITVLLRDETGAPLWKGIGYGGQWQGPGCGGGYGDYSYILQGTPFNYQGEVISGGTTGFGIHGSGLVISTTDGNVELHGLGPIHYWYSLEVTRPVVGDVITAEGYAVDFNGTTVNVLMSITLDNGTVVQLRDPETGAPLWRNGNWNE